VASGLALLLRTRRQRRTPAIQAPIRQDWLDRRHEEIIDPELPIIDPYRVGELLDGVRRDEKKQTIDNPSPKTKPHVVIFIHGIRARALWQNELRNSPEANGFVVQPTNYGYFDVVRFLFPHHLLTGKVINEVTRHIRHIGSINRDADYSILAHSFGIFIFAKMLKDNTDLEFNRIIFCGSVVPRKVPLEDYRKNFASAVIRSA
jgi:hypothetical protein